MSNHTIKMKNFIHFGLQNALLSTALLSVLTIGLSLRLTHDISVSLKNFNGEDNSRGDHHESYVLPKEGVMKKEEEEEVGTKIYPTGGSTLPDCSYACGPCLPCKRVMVSYRCSAVESCPVVYRCMCKGKYYHVPSN